MPTRPELDRFDSYQPGVSIQELRRRYGLRDIVKLASNENPLGPSPKGLKAYKKVASDLFRYPDSRSVDLRRTIADRHRLDISNVIVGAGSDEIIELLAKAFLTPSDEIVVSASSFLQYRIAANLMGARVIVTPMRDLRHDLRAMAAAAGPRTKFIFVVNPNNPTGTYNPREEVVRFLSLIPDHVIPVFDEAYFEYASAEFEDYPSMLATYERERPLVVLRTFSKIYGLAGLRVGFGVAPESMVIAMDKIRPPFNVSIPAQVAAQAAIFDVAHVRKSVQHNLKEKAKLSEELARMGFDVVPSAANFLLFKVAPLKGRALFEELLRKGIIARSVDEYALPEYLRVTVGLPGDNRKFLTALREVVKKP